MMFGLVSEALEIETVCHFELTVVSNEKVLETLAQAEGLLLGSVDGVRVFWLIEHEGEHMADIKKEEGIDQERWTLGQEPRVSFNGKCNVSHNGEDMDCDVWHYSVVQRESH
jgi:hypothetical protein